MQRGRRKATLRESVCVCVCVCVCVHELTRNNLSFTPTHSVSSCKFPSILYLKVNTWVESFIFLCSLVYSFAIAMWKWWVLISHQREESSIFKVQAKSGWVIWDTWASAKCQVLEGWSMVPPPWRGGSLMWWKIPDPAPQLWVAALSWLCLTLGFLASCLTCLNLR